jgi:hypothetical protein
MKPHLRMEEPMNEEQAFKNLVLIVMRAQKAGLLELHEAVALNESLLVVSNGLKLNPPQQVAPVVTEAAQAQA